MIVELHAIQSFAPANLNRDDQGAPKDCTFGGVPRARVSSQSWKRAMRVAFRHDESTQELGTRTKRAHQALVDRIRDREPSLDDDIAGNRAAVLLEAPPLGLSLKRAEEDARVVKTGQLIFFRTSDLDTLAELAIEHADALDQTVSSIRPDAPKGAGRPALPRDAQARVGSAMTTPGRALDVALFGRLVAEMPEANVDAACQVAHAVGTHRVAYEGDYYTAVDDLRPQDTEGADMIGEIQFNASCFYRYAALDTEQLAANLGVTAEPQHLKAALTSFVRAFVTSAPSGKQTTFAARNLPTAVLAVRRKSGAANLINAFARPVGVPRDDADVPSTSTERMLEEFTTLERMYGERDGGTSAALLSARENGSAAAWTAVQHLDELVAFAAGG